VLISKPLSCLVVVAVVFLLLCLIDSISVIFPFYSYFSHNVGTFTICSRVSSLQTRVVVLLAASRGAPHLARVAAQHGVAQRPGGGHRAQGGYRVLLWAPAARLRGSKSPLSGGHLFFMLMHYHHV